MVYRYYAGGENMLKALEAYSETLIERYREKLTENQVNATGELSETADFRIHETKGGNFRIVLLLADYFQYVETGRGPGKFPPVEDILDWIEAKPILPKPYTLPSGRQVIPTNEQLAFLIGRKIAEEGIEPRPYMAVSEDELRQEFRNSLKEALAKDIEKSVKQTLTQRT